MNNFRSLVSVLIHDETHGTPRHELILEVGPTPGLLLAYGGFQALDLIVKGKAISKMCFDHGLGTALIQKLPELLTKPKSLYLSASQPESAVVMTFELHRGYPVIVPIHKNKMIGRGRLCNEVASMYAKQGPDPEAKWKREGLLLWHA